MEQKLFGTDGIRGLANRFPMQPETAIKVGRALAVLLEESSHHFLPSSLSIGRHNSDTPKKVRRARVVIGKDTRLSGYMLEQALSSGLCSMGADVLFIGPLPTPGVAFVTQSMRADAGVMISASHNPFQDNGIKIFTGDGFKLPTQYEERLESLILSELVGPTGEHIGRAQRIDDVLGRYLVHLKSAFPKDLDLLGMRLIVDCAHGAAYKVAPLVFEELGAEVIREGVQPDGTNINLHCGALYPARMTEKVLRYRANLGIALDGDADRCILADENGDILNGDQILGICALYAAEQGTLPGMTVVGTIMSQWGLEQTLQRAGIQFLRAPVGDRHVLESMLKGGYVLGGEPSGHTLLLDHATTGDGILAALRILEIMKKTQKTLGELKTQVLSSPQAHRSIRIRERIPLEQLPKLQAQIQKVEDHLGKNGRVVVRYSGTEPCLRLMVEAQTEQECDSLLNTLLEALETEGP
jgi:phosphoglucosamine mutase